MDAYATLLHTLDALRDTLAHQRDAYQQHADTAEADRAVVWDCLTLADDLRELAGMADGFSRIYRKT
jgi:hypothetical protein